MRKYEPVEIVLIAIPVLAEVIAVVLFIFASGLLANIIAAREPVKCRAGSIASYLTSCEVAQ